MKYKYKIINTVLDSEFEIPFAEKNLKKNATEKEQNNIEISKIHRISSDDVIMTYLSECKGNKIMTYDQNFVLTDESLTKVGVYIQKGERFEVLLLHLFRAYSVLKHRILQFHSSLIKTSEQGIMFLGPSGIGKTTQAELWQKYRSSLIINGDIVFVQETDSGFLGWGTPWHGSSPYCENTSVPLKAMVVLKQSDQNSIRELTGFEKVTEVSNSVFYPQWLENGMELCLETLDHLLTSIPVYELRCRPDEDAVRLTEQTIFS